jgi:hypothetical protein
MIRCDFEACAPRVWVDADSEGDRDRLMDWLGQGPPELRLIVSITTQLSRKREAA